MKDFFKALGAGALLLMSGTLVLLVIGSVFAVALTAVGVELTLLQTLAIPTSVILLRMLWFAEGPFGGEFWQRRGQ